MQPGRHSPDFHNLFQRTLFNVFSELVLFSVCLLLPILPQFVKVGPNDTSTVSRSTIVEIAEWKANDGQEEMRGVLTCVCPRVYLVWNVVWSRSAAEEEKENEGGGGRGGGRSSSLQAVLYIINYVLLCVQRSAHEGLGSALHSNSSM